jgi:hypothetical protein
LLVLYHEVILLLPFAVTVVLAVGVLGVPGVIALVFGVPVFPH